MKLKLFAAFFFFGILFVFSQTKVSGYVLDEYNVPVAYANVIFKGTSEGTITNEEGRFYLESQNTQQALIVSFLGYETLDIPLDKKVNYDLKFILKEEASALDEIVINVGKQSKKSSKTEAKACPMLAVAWVVRMYSRRMASKARRTLGFEPRQAAGRVAQGLR